MAIEFHAGPLPQPVNSANVAVGVLALPEGECSILLYAIFIQAGQALLFVGKSAAKMATFVNLIACLRH